MTSSVVILVKNFMMLMKREAGIHGLSSTMLLNVVKPTKMFSKIKFMDKVV